MVPIHREMVQLKRCPPTTTRSHVRAPRRPTRPCSTRLAALDPAQRGVAVVLRHVAETFAEVPDGKHTAHTLRLLAHFLDPTDGR